MSPIAPGKRTTIYDIAKVTGLSPSTVSRGLGKPGRLSAETERRIRDTADMLGYQANPLARALPTGRTGNIGMVVPVINHPVFSDVVRGVEREASQLEHSVMIAETGNRADLEAEAVKRLLSVVDGLVLVSPRQPDRELRRLADDKHLVLVNRMVPGIESIVPDLVPGYREAVCRLAGLGHTSIGFLGNPESSWTTEQRRSALEAEARSAGMSFREGAAASDRVSGGERNLDLALALGATAVFTYNDLIAVGILHACHARRIVVPDEFSLVGYDDIFGADFVIPTLSTIRPPLHEMGSAAVTALLVPAAERSDGPTDLVSTFVERHSTGAAPS